MDVNKYRKPDYEIEGLILGRWSPRAMSGEAIDEDELMKLFEAARWAPSSFNNQPWRFIYSLRGSNTFKNYLGLLTKGNRDWAKRAAALVIICSKKTFDYNDNPSRTHSFDTGSAWENLALQGNADGLVIHAMEGFDYGKARKLANIPDKLEVEAMVAIGKPGDKNDLSEKNQKNEFPSNRRPINEIVFEGKFED